MFTINTFTWFCLFAMLIFTISMFDNNNDNNIGLS